VISRIRIIRAVPIVALVALLAGCAPAVLPTHAHSAAAPTSTPSPAPASAPGSRVPLGCAGLLGASSVQALAGTTAKVDRDENTPPTDIQSVAQLQYGALSCSWDGISGNPSSPGAELDIDIAPDAKAAFESRFVSIMADQSQNPHAAATENAAGDQSGYWCGTTIDALGADANIPDCDAEMLVGNYWVGIEVVAVNGLSREQLTTGLVTAMTEITGKLRAAGPAPTQWAAPATTPPGFCTDSTSTTSVRSIVGDATLAAAKAPVTSIDASTVGLDGPSARCAWNSKSYGYLELYLLGGGSWGLPAISPAKSGDSPLAGKAYASMTVAGATSAKMACAEGFCDAYLAVGTSAVEISYNDPGAAKNPVELGAFAKAIAAS
jgi:hypothetical protein